MKRLGFIVFWTAFCLFTATLPISADAPVEDYYIQPSLLPDSMFIECKGALTVHCMDAPSMKKYYNKVVPEVMVTLYEQSSGKFHKTNSINILVTKPFSGYVYGRTRLQRFPAIAQNGNFVKIVHDVEKNLRAWVKLEDFKGLLPKGWGESVFLTWFDRGKYQKYDCIDIFLLLGKHGRKLYDSPCETSQSRWIKSYPDIDKDAINPVVVEQRNGFVRLGFYDSCEGKIRKSKWIRIRDDTGKLTIWPHICLSC